MRLELFRRIQIVWLDSRKRTKEFLATTTGNDHAAEAEKGESARGGNDALASVEEEVTVVEVVDVGEGEEAELVETDAVAVVDANSRGSGAGDSTGGPVHVAIGEGGVEARAPEVGVEGEGELEGVEDAVVIGEPTNRVPGDDEYVGGAVGVGVKGAVPNEVGIGASGVAGVNVGPEGGDHGGNDRAWEAARREGFEPVRGVEGHVAVVVDEER